MKKKIVLVTGQAGDAQGWGNMHVTEAVRDAVQASGIDCRILCAVRKGVFGCERLNELVLGKLKKMHGGCPIPVMITRNDQSLGVSNGDVGVVMPLADQSASRQPATAPGNTTGAYAQSAASYAPAQPATTYTPSATPASSSASEPTVVDTLHEIREGVDTSRDIVQGIKDIGEMLK